MYVTEDIAACLEQKLNIDLLNKVPNVQMSDADIHRHRLTGDAMKYKSSLQNILQHLNLPHLIRKLRIISC